MRTQMIRLYRDPSGEKIFSVASKSISTSKGDDQDINTLRSRVKELENKLSTMEMVRFCIDNNYIQVAALATAHFAILLPKVRLHYLVVAHINDYIIMIWSSASLLTHSTYA